MVFNAVRPLLDLWKRLSRLSVSALMLNDVNDVSLCSIMLKLFSALLPVAVIAAFGG